MPARTTDSRRPRREAAYDPDQDPEERRALRRDYRDLNKITEENQSNDLTPDELAEKVRRADLLFDKVKGTSEATLDSQFLLRATQMGAARARAMKSGAGAFDLDDFVARLISFMGGRKGMQLGEDDDAEDDGSGEPLDWERIGRRALAKSRRVPVMDFMLGPLSIEQKKRNAPKRSKLEKNMTEERRPQEITEKDITRSENETTKNVATLERILDQQEGPVNFFKFVVNPNDFGQSVENMFYLSFLIRDGKCVFEVSEEAEPVVFLCAPPSQEDYDKGLKKQQMVSEFDMETWKYAIETYDIKESMIPQRPKAQTRIGNKWYG